MTEDLSRLLGNSEIFSISEDEIAVYINEVKKQSPEKAYCSFELLEAFKDAVPVLSYDYIYK